MTTTQSNVQLNITAGNVTGLADIVRMLGEVSKGVTDSINAFKATPHQKQAIEEARAQLERERQVTQAAITDQERYKLEREQIRTQSLEASRQATLERRGELTRFAAVSGAGNFGAQSIHGLASGNYSGMVGGLSFLARANPWVLAGTAVAAAGTAVGLSQQDKEAKYTKDVADAVADAAAYGAFESWGAPDSPENQKRSKRFTEAAQSLGYNKLEATRRYGAYARTAGLGDGGLSPEQVLALERTRGIGADVSGAYSSMFAAGGGAASRLSVADNLRMAIADGLDAGLKNAHLPQYLAQVSAAVTRYSSQGINTAPEAILSAVRGLRATGPGFEGSRGVEALEKVRGAGEGILGSLRNFIPQDMINQQILGQALQSTGGDLFATYRLVEQRIANGNILGDYRDAARVFGDPGLGAMALLSATPGLGSGQAAGLLRYQRGGVRIGPLADDSTAKKYWRQWQVQQAGEDDKLLDFDSLRRSQKIQAGAGSIARQVSDGWGEVFDSAISNYRQSPWTLGLGPLARDAGRLLDSVGGRVPMPSQPLYPSPITIELRDPRTGTVEQHALPLYAPPGSPF